MEGNNTVERKNEFLARFIVKLEHSIMCDLSVTKFGRKVQSNPTRDPMNKYLIGCCFLHHPKNVFLLGGLRDVSKIRF